MITLKLWRPNWVLARRQCEIYTFKPPKINGGMLDSFEYTVLRTSTCKAIFGHFERTIPLIARCSPASLTVSGGRVSLMDSLLFHITLCARDHWKYFRKAQNNAMRLFRLCNPGIQKSSISWYAVGFGNVLNVTKA